MLKISSWPLVVLSLVSVLISCGPQYPDFVDSLDESFRDREIFLDSFNDKTNQIRISLERQTDPLQIYDLRQRLAEAYTVVSFDTTHFYLSRNLNYALESKDDFRTDESRILIAINYANCGYYQEASHTLGRIDTSRLDTGLKANYCKAHIIMTRRSRNNAPSTDDFDQNQRELEHWLSEMEPFVDSTSYAWNYIKWEQSRNRKDYISGISLGHKLLEAAPRNSPEYSEACFYLALSYKYVDDDYNYLKWLCNSATNDIHIGANSDIALIALCNYFYREGDIIRAYDFAVGKAFPDALQMNNRYNLNTLSSVVQLVSEANEIKIKKNERLLVISLLILLVLAIGLITTVILLHKNNKILRSTHRELKQTGKVKERYITDFLLMLAHNTMDRRTNDAHSIKMLHSGRSKELLEEIERYREEEDSNTFVKLFDSTFLDLYPDFVDKFNALLKPDEQIVPPEPDTLTPELRIYALMKLGVTDLQDIAVLLQYANSTIYNYRVKVLSRTLLSKKEFENKLKNL